RPALLIAAHAREARGTEHALDDGIVLGSGGGRAADEAAETPNRPTRVGEHVLVSQYLHVRLLRAGDPREQMIEVIAEVDLARDEAFEEVAERTVGEIVVLHEAA